MEIDFQSVRRTLERAKIDEVVTRLKASAADAFFEAHPGLREGYAVYQQRVKARAEVGVPLAPGGAFILGDSAVIAGCLAEAHTMLARLLKVPWSAIKLRIDRPGTNTNIRLTADVAVDRPDSVHRLLSPEDQQVEIEELTRAHIQAALREVNPVFLKNLRERLVSVRQYRPELCQAVIPWKDRNEQGSESDPE